MKPGTRVALVIGLGALAGAAWWLGAPPVPSATGEGRPARDTLPVDQTTPVIVPASANLDASEVAQESERQPGLPTAGEILIEAADNPSPAMHRSVALRLAGLVRNASLPLAEREEALEHTLNLSLGHETEVLNPLVLAPEVPDHLADRILDEALNRSLPYQAELYLAALGARRTPTMRAKIRSHLAFLTDGPDLGDNPGAWRDAVRQAQSAWLAPTPEATAETPANDPTH